MQAHQKLGRCLFEKNNGVEAWNITKIVSIVSAVAAGLLVAGCELGPPPPPQEMASAAICDGQPNWCLVARSEMDDHRPAYIYIDGAIQGLILPSETKRFPVKAGETRQINFCAVLDFGASKYWRCSTPTATKFDANSTLVVFPHN